MFRLISNHGSGEGPGTRCRSCSQLLQGLLCLQLSGLLVSKRAAARER